MPDDTWQFYVGRKDIKESKTKRGLRGDGVLNCSTVILYQWYFSHSKSLSLCVCERGERERREWQPYGVGLKIKVQFKVKSTTTCCFSLYFFTEKKGCFWFLFLLMHVHTFGTFHLVYTQWMCQCAQETGKGCFNLFI